MGLIPIYHHYADFLTLKSCILMDVLIHFDEINMGLPILYLNPLHTNRFFLLVGYNKLGIVHSAYLGMSGHNLKKNVIFCLKFFFTFANSVDPDEMQHYAAFYLGLHCLQKSLLRGFPEYTLG